jgi:hypothetical protein
VTALSNARWIHNRCASLLILSAALVVAVVAAVLAPPDLAMAWVSESGPVETLQAIVLFAAAAGVWHFRRAGEAVSTPTAVSFLLVAMGARELDWHKTWTQGNMLKLSFYLGPANVVAKLASAVVVVVLAIAVAYLLRRYARAMWVGVRRREPLPVTVATFFASLMLARVADKSLLLLQQNFDYEAGVSATAAKMIVEETLELVLPLLVLLGAAQRDAVGSVTSDVHDRDASSAGLADGAAKTLPRRG